MKRIVLATAIGVALGAVLNNRFARLRHVTLHSGGRLSNATLGYGILRIAPNSADVIVEDVLFRAPRHRWWKVWNRPVGHGIHIESTFAANGAPLLPTEPGHVAAQVASVLNERLGDDRDLPEATLGNYFGYVEQRLEGKE
jgi:hypothetical protein